MRFDAVAFRAVLAATALAFACAPTTAEEPRGSSSPATASPSALPSASSALASTTPMPTPIAFSLPTTCSVASVVVTGPAYDWRLDCGSDANMHPRITMQSILSTQGWRSCGEGLATAIWQKNDVVTVVSETSGTSGDLIRVGQHPRAQSECP